MGLVAGKINEFLICPTTTLSCCPSCVLRKTLTFGHGFDWVSRCTLYLAKHFFLGVCLLIAPRRLMMIWIGETNKQQKQEQPENQMLLSFGVEMSKKIVLATALETPPCQKFIISAFWAPGFTIKHFSLKPSYLWTKTLHFDDSSSQSNCSNQN